MTEVRWVDVRTVEVTDAGGKDDGASSGNETDQHLQQRKMGLETYPAIKALALAGSVSLASEIIRRPASPPSRRPSSTSTATPALRARSTYGLAMAMFSSSDYQITMVRGGILNLRNK